MEHRQGGSPRDIDPRSGMARHPNMNGSIGGVEVLENGLLRDGDAFWRHEIPDP